MPARISIHWSKKTSNAGTIIELPFRNTPCCFIKSLRMCCTKFIYCPERKARYSRCNFPRGPALNIILCSKIKALDLLLQTGVCDHQHREFASIPGLYWKQTQPSASASYSQLFTRETSFRVKFGLLKVCINYKLTLLLKQNPLTSDHQIPFEEGVQAVILTVSLKEPWSSLWLRLLFPTPPFQWLSWNQLITI